MSKPTLSEIVWSRVGTFNHRSHKDCAPWMGHKLPGGYGTLTDPETGKPMHAHRAMLTLKTGKPIPDGMVVRHLCHEPSCVRPSHLTLGTPGENAQDRRDAGRHRMLPELSDLDVEAIRWSYATERFSQGDLAEMFYGTRTAQPHIARIVQGRTFTHVGGPVTRRGRGNKAARRK